MYKIDFADEALDDLRWFKKHEQNEILEGVISRKGGRFMKTVTVSPRSKAINSLLTMAQENVLLLQTAEGKQFILTPLTDLQAFYIGDSDELTDEIAISRANQNFMKFLDERGKRAKLGKGTSIEDVRRQLGL